MKEIFFSQGDHNFMSHETPTGSSRLVEIPDPLAARYNALSSDVRNYVELSYLVMQQGDKEMAAEHRPAFEQFRDKVVADPAKIQELSDFVTFKNSLQGGEQNGKV